MIRIENYGWVSCKLWPWLEKIIMYRFCKAVIKMLKLYCSMHSNSGCVLKIQYRIKSIKYITEVSKNGNDTEQVIYHVWLLQNRVSY